MQAPADIPLLITVLPDTSPNAKPLISAERRITPSWSIQTLKAKLEPVTGIPASSQNLRTKSLTSDSYVILQPDNALVSDPLFSLTRNSEIEVLDTRPAGARQNLTDVSAVEKYKMPAEQYEQLDDSVLAWKKRQQLGRFDPHARPHAEIVAERRQKDAAEVTERKITVGSRCRVGGEDVRRGVVRYVGEIGGLGGEKEEGCVWVGVELDEPMGRNNGSVKVEIVGSDGKKEVQLRRVFECRDKYGVFSRPEKVDCGDWPPLDDLMDDDMEEI